jgi:hypothetical protein
MKMGPSCQYMFWATQISVGYDSGQHFKVMRVKVNFLLLFKFALVLICVVIIPLMLGKARIRASEQFELNNWTHPTHISNSRTKWYSPKNGIRSLEVQPGLGCLLSDPFFFIYLLSSPPILDCVYCRCTGVLCAYWLNTWLVEESKTWTWKLELNCSAVVWCHPSMIPPTMHKITAQPPLSNPDSESLVAHTSCPHLL